MEIKLQLQGKVSEGLFFSFSLPEEGAILTRVLTGSLQREAVQL